MKEPLVTDERRDQVCFGVTTLSTLNKCCGLSAVKPFVDVSGVSVVSCRQAELALADL